MYTIIICGILGFVITLCINLYLKEDEGFVIIISTISMTLIGFLLGTLIAIVIPSKTKVVLDKTLYLECLQDNNSVQGKFFLGSGVIDGSMKYVFYYQTSEGYKMMQLSYDEATIKYSNDTPKIEYYKTIKTEAIINKFSLGYGCRNRDQYIIYVPKGTIKQSYNLDAQ